MANSKYKYVKQFEDDPKCLPNCFIVIRVDGKNFHKFTTIHRYERPNDIRGLNLINACAVKVIHEFPDILFSYSQSDEISFVFRKDTKLFERRSSKILTVVVSHFSSTFVYLWDHHFGDQKLEYPPTFDARVILYPCLKNLRDYISWRQVDCHINNLYNTCFWKLVMESNLSQNEAQVRLKGTLSSDKNELLFSTFGVNYNNIPEVFRKGSFVCRQNLLCSLINLENVQTINHPTLEAKFYKLYTDLISDSFWNNNMSPLE